MVVEHYSDICPEIHAFNRSPVKKLAVKHAHQNNISIFATDSDHLDQFEQYTSYVCLDLSVGVEISLIKRLVENVNVAICS